LRPENGREKICRSVIWSEETDSRSMRMSSRPPDTMERMDGKEPLRTILNDSYN